ncbi:DUF4153 domain-containing protein [Frateuria defendens]|uniref:DUF4153 domain-containing protein n=1 Tax=Frateuria defendens TaxID=2219559 RepID=UPI00066FDF73|nr:DUF4153 domain-containing protein [Frateuria defendens]
MPEQDALPRRERGAVVLIAVLTGLALYLADQGQRAGWWPFAAPTRLVGWYTLAIGLPPVMVLALRRLDDRRYARALLALTAGLLALATWAGWSIDAPSIHADTVIAPYVLSLGGALFLLLPFLQAYLDSGRWRPDYPRLFGHAWQNGLILLLAVAFVGVCWLLLTLWAELFALVGLRIFRELFGWRPFVYLATGLMAGLGLLVGRTQQRALEVTRQILFGVCRGLLPLVAFIGVLFVLSLPFTGLEGLWRTRMAASILIALQLVMVLLLNAVRQDGTGNVPYPAWLRRIVEAGLLSLPLYAGLTLYALYLRVAQYGWTAERVWVALLALLLAGHALGYAVAVLRWRRGWLHDVPRVNVALALCSVLLAAAADSPLLDPHRIAVASQLAHWRAAGKAPEELDLDYLRFDSGRLGYRAVQALRDDPDVIASATLSQAMTDALARTSPMPWRRLQAPPTPAELRGRIRLGPGVAPVEDSYLDALLTHRLPDAGCLRKQADCLLLTPDLRGDGQRQHLLCEVGGLVECVLATRDAQGWTAQGSVTWAWMDQHKVRAALLAGQLVPRQPDWPLLEVAGERAALFSPEAAAPRSDAKPR